MLNSGGSQSICQNTLYFQVCKRNRSLCDALSIFTRFHPVELIQISEELFKLGSFVGTIFT